MKNTADPSKPSPRRDSAQGISNRPLDEENDRQRKVLPFPEKREGKKGTAPPKK